jgi:hypothetical protein
MNNSLVVLGNTNIVGNITINSSLNILGNMNLILPEYPNNTIAKNNGIPIWGWYRTGGILKIRLEDVPPVVYLTGGTSLTIYLGYNYYDTGGYAIDYLNNIIPVYLSNINLSSSILNTNILISGLSTLITQTTTLSIGNYTATYQATDFIGNVGYNYRLFNVILTVYNIFDTSIGNLQIASGLNFNSLNNTDWTIEVWLNMYQNDNGDNSTIIDFRNPNQGAYSPTTHIWVQITNMKPVIQAMSNRSQIGSSINRTIQKNKWTHVVWMRKNNILYTFLNGYASPGESIPSYLNSLASLNAIVMGTYSDWVSNTGANFKGQISQPLITLGAKYNTSGFIPKWNLGPLVFSNVLFWLSNNIDVISGKSLVLNNTVVQTNTSINQIPPTISLNGPAIVLTLLNNNYIELGIIASDYFGNNISIYTISGNVNTSILGIYVLTYTVNDTDNIQSSITRSIYVVNNISLFANLSFWLDPSDLSTIQMDSSKNLITITDKINNILLGRFYNIPKVKSNGINNKSVLDFTNGSGIRSINLYMNSYNVTLAIVVILNQIGNQGLIWGYFSPQNGHDNDIILRYTETSGYVNWHTANDNSNVQLTYLPGIPVLYLGTLTNGTSRFFKMVNLNTGVSTNISGTNGLSMLLRNAYFYLGCSEINELSYSLIGECMYWDRVLNNNELNNIQAYFYNKWKSTTNNVTILSPYLTLNGNSTIYIIINNPYTELGVVAADYLGNSLSYTISGSVDITILGFYNITYSCSNAYGTYSLTRTVNVVNNLVEQFIADWINRVTAAGGNLSSTEINAHFTFVFNLQNNNNAWANIIRLNTFCGDSLQAALCPIKPDGGLSGNGASINDTYISNTPSYNRTGGMTGTGGALNTGLKFSTLTPDGQNLHFGMYAFSQLSGRSMGVWRASVWTKHYLLNDEGTNNGGWSNQMNFNTDSNSIGMNIMQCRTKTEGPLYYRRGIKTACSPSTYDMVMPSDWPCTLFAANGSGDGTNPLNAIYGNLNSQNSTRSGGYTIGYGLTDAQITDITNAFNQLNSDLSRS